MGAIRAASNAVIAKRGKKYIDEWTVLMNLIADRDEDLSIQLFDCVSGTSTSTLALQVGIQTVNVGPGKKFVPAMRITIGHDARNLMSANVIDYTDNEDGPLQFEVSSEFDVILENHEVSSFSSWYVNLQGDEGTPGSSWLKYNGVPVDAYGRNGDFTVNTITGDVYFKEDDAQTGPIFNVRGPGALAKGGKHNTNTSVNANTKHIADCTAGDLTFTPTGVWTEQDEFEIEKVGTVGKLTLAQGGFKINGKAEDGQLLGPLQGRLKGTYVSAGYGFKTTFIAG
jgi:hypothetical protein